MKKFALFMLLGLIGTMNVNVYADITLNNITDEVKTTSDGYSIGGECDPNYPLYINGKKVEVTDDGYFSSYEQLVDGENVFKIENSTDSKTITINKYVPETNADEDVFTSSSFVGVVAINNPTVRFRPDEENDDLVTPYAKGTLLNIVAKNSEYYKTSNGNYIYIVSVDATDEVYSENTIKDVSFSDDTITLQMNHSVEYSVDLEKDYIDIYLYDSKNGAELENPNVEVFSNVTVSEDNNKLIYHFDLKNKGSFIGYKTVIENDKMMFVLNKANVAEEKSLKGTTIVLDAGHGGADSGTFGLGSVNEKTINLAITGFVKDYLQEKGAEVILTRPDDEAVALADRVSVINDIMPDVSVSIHCNAIDSAKDWNKIKGTINFFTFDSHTGFVDNITNSLNVTSSRSNLALTRITSCPSVLIETGFLTNPEDYQKLTDENYQKEFAINIGKAIEKYLIDYSSLIFEDKISNIKVEVPVGEKRISINGNSFETDTNAYISNSSVMIPLRTVSEAIIKGDDSDENIVWNGEEKSVTIKYNKKVIVFKQGSNVVIIDGNDFTTDNNATVEINDGRMFIPLRTFAEAIGADVDWDNDTKTVTFIIENIAE